MTTQNTPILEHGDYRIYRAQAYDLDRLVAMLLELQNHVEGSNPALWRMTTTARSDLRRQLASRLTAANCCALVADHDRDGVIGVVFGRILVNKRYTPSRTGQIDQAFVCGRHRRMGVGSRLVAALLPFFAAEGVEDIVVRFAVGNGEADAFWASLGFVERITIAGADRQAVEQRIEAVSER